MVNVFLMAFSRRYLIYFQTRTSTANLATDTINRYFLIVKAQTRAPETCTNASISPRERLLATRTTKHTRGLLYSSQINTLIAWREKWRFAVHVTNDHLITRCCLQLHGDIRRRVSNKSVSGTSHQHVIYVHPVAILWFCDNERVAMRVD